MTITTIDILEGRRHELELIIEEAERPFRAELREIEISLRAIGYLKPLMPDEQKPEPA